MNITSHARKRWLERRNPGAIPEDIDQEISASFELATVVHEEEEKEKGRIQYRVKDDILFVYSVPGEKLVTVISIDYGFDPEINLDLCKRQTQLVLDLKKRISAEEILVEKLRGEIDNRLKAVAGDIAELTARLEAAQAAERRLEQQKVEAARELEALRAKFANEFARLKYSIRYRVDYDKIIQAI